MKKIFYLMSVACLMMAVSCDPDNGKDNTPEPPAVTVPDGVKTAGSELILKAEGLAEDAEFYLESGDSKTALEDVTVSTSGVSVRLPYTLGEYTLVVEQDDTAYELGKITVAVTDVVLPETAAAGDEITVAGNGFASDAVIVFGDKESATTAEPSGVKVAVPAEATGECEVKVKQAGTEQSLGKLTVAAKKLRTKIAIQMDMMGDGTFMDIYSCSAVYGDNNEPVSLAVYNFMLEEFGMSDYSYQITKKDNVYSFDGDMASWSFTIEDGHVKTFTFDGKNYAWEYNEDGQLTSFYVDSEEAYKIAYENGNYKNSVSGNDLVTRNDEIDVTLVSENWMGIEMNSEIYYAAVLFGWAGKPSKNYPAEIEGGTIKYTSDNGYVTSAENEMFSIICEYK